MVLMCGSKLSSFQSGDRIGLTSVVASKLNWFLCGWSKLTVCLLRSHQTVLSTQRHRYTLCPCWFIPERFKFCGHRLCCREKPKQPHQSRQSKWNASVPVTRTQQNKPDQKNMKNGTEKTKKPTRVLKNVMQEDHKGCKKNNIRREERGPKLSYYECDDRLTWFLCGWRSKLTRFSMRAVYRLVLVWASRFNWFWLGGRHWLHFSVRDWTWFYFSLGIGIDFFCVWGSKTTWFLYLDRSWLGFCVVMFDHNIYIHIWSLDR